MHIDFKVEKIWLWSEVVDFRKSIDGLCAIIVDKLKDNPGEGLYIFYNRGRNRLKLLGWHGNGFVLIYKRLDKGKFAINISGGKIDVNTKQLNWLLAGLDWKLFTDWNSANFSDYF